MSRPEPGLPKFLEDKKQLAPNETFSFTCHPGVPCFNTCCADVNIIMTPLDVLGLALGADAEIAVVGVRDGQLATAADHVLLPGAVIAARAEPPLDRVAARQQHVVAVDEVLGPVAQIDVRPLRRNHDDEDRFGR